jgi:hypothetical protein
VPTIRWNEVTVAAVRICQWPARVAARPQRALRNPNGDDHG